MHTLIQLKTCMHVRRFWRVFDNWQYISFFLALLVEDDVTSSFFETGNLLFGGLSIQTSDDWTIGEYRNQYHLSCIYCELRTNSLHQIKSAWCLFIYRLNVFTQGKILIKSDTKIFIACCVWYLSKTVTDIKWFIL